MDRKSKETDFYSMRSTDRQRDIFYLAENQSEIAARKRQTNRLKISEALDR